MDNSKADKIAILTIIIAVIIIIGIGFSMSAIVKNRREVEKTRQTPVGDEERELIKQKLNENFNSNMEELNAR